MAIWDDCLIDNDVATIKCFEPAYERLVYAVIAFIGIVFFVMMIVSGYTFLFSSGDPKKLEQAKASLSKAVLGMIIIACAYFILLTISEITGVKEIMKFEIPQTQ